MRVLVYTSLFPNAAVPTHAVFVYQRVSHFAKRGHQVEVVAPIPYAPGFLAGTQWGAFSRIPDVENIGGITVHHPRYPLIPKISMAAHGALMYLGSRKLISRLQADKRFDLVDAHYVYPDGFAGASIAKLLRVPYVVSARGTDMTLFPGFRTIRPQIARTLRNADATIGVCKPLRDAMVALGAAPGTSFSIGNGIDLHRFEPVPRDDARQRLGIPSYVPVIVSVGALVPVKGHEFTIRAIARLTPAFPKLRLYIVGKGPDQSKLERLAANLGVVDRIVFAGPQPNEELKYWYGAADASCLASSREGWANVLLESLACGTPAVATRVWGTPEVINSEEVGLLVDQSAESLANGVETALRKEWNRTSIAQYARSRTWDTVASEVEQVFLQVLGKRSSQSAGAFGL